MAGELPVLPRDPVTLKIREVDLPARLQPGAVLTPADLGVTAAKLDAFGQVLDGLGNPVTGGSGGGIAVIANGDTTKWIECPNDEDTPRPATLPLGFTRFGWKKPGPVPPSGMLPGDKWDREFPA
jgi:hypothetical protein